jgi:transposase
MEFPNIVPNIVGLDVHSRQITACFLTTDESGENVTEFAEFRTFKSGIVALTNWIKERSPEAVIMESTGIYWKSPRDLLYNSGIKCMVVNARHVKNVPGRKTDIADSQWLAMLGRAGLLRASFVPTPEFSKLRQVSRYRQQAVTMLSSEKNRLYKTLTESGVRLGHVVSDLSGQSARRMVEAIIDGATPLEALALATTRLKASQDDILLALEGNVTETDQFLLKTILDHVKYLESEINQLDRKLLNDLKPCQSILELLQTMPGVDVMAAAMILVEIGPDMTEFGSADRLVSWAGMCPGNNESAGKRKSGRTTKGNGWLRRVLCEVANAAAKTQSYFQQKFKNLVVRRGRKRTIIALAHKILRIMYYLISRKEPYKDRTVDYQALVAKKNAPRWIAALKKFNLLPKVAVKSTNQA